MNMKSILSSLLVACCIIGQMISPTEGTKLQWKKSLEYVPGNYVITLLDVPSEGVHRYDVTLYQRAPREQWDKILSRKSEDMFASPLSTKMDVELEVPFDTFTGPSKIVKAKVVYPTGRNIPDVESEILDFDDLVMGNFKMLLIVVCFIGGVCVIAVVAGCILCQRQRRRGRFPLQQPVAVMGQDQLYQTQPHVVVQGQNYQLPQTVPQNQNV